MENWISEISAGDTHRLRDSLEVFLEGDYIRHDDGWKNKMKWNKKKTYILLCLVCGLGIVMILSNKEQIMKTSNIETEQEKYIEDIVQTTQQELISIEDREELLEQDKRLQERQPYNIIYGKWEVVRSSNQYYLNQFEDYIKGRDDVSQIDSETATKIGIQVTITPNYIEYQKDDKMVRRDEYKVKSRIDTKLDFIEQWYYKINREVKTIKWVEEEVKDRRYCSFSFINFINHIEESIFVGYFLVVDDETLIALSGDVVLKLKRIEHMPDVENYYQYPEVFYKQKRIESMARLGSISYVEENKEELEKNIDPYRYLPTYGNWQVTKIVGRSEQACMEEEEISKLIGTAIKMHQRYIKINGKIVAEDYKVKIDTIPIVSEEQVHMKGFPSLKSIGITNDYFVFIEIVSGKENEIYREPLRKIYVKDSDTLIVEEQGYYLELKRIEEPSDLLRFYEFC